jgi:hypothetical protein
MREKHNRLTSTRGVHLLLAFVGYSALSVLFFEPSNPFSSSQIVGGAVGDPAQMIWFLAWTPFAIIHHTNPFFSNYLDYPYGINMMSNTSSFLLGLLGFPLTLLKGPIETFNVLMRLGLVASATAMYFVLTKVTKFRLAAFAGGIFYGYGSYEIFEGGQHLNLAFNPFPPLILWCIYEIFIGQNKSVRKFGIWLAVLSSMQFFIDAEILSDTMIVALIGLALIALANRELVKDKIINALPAIYIGIVIGVVVLAYPLWMLLLGPRHINGPVDLEWITSQYRADLFGFFEKTTEYLLQPNGHYLASGNGNYVWTSGDAYVGLPIFLVIGGLFITSRKDRIVHWIGILAVIAMTLSLGPELTVDRNITHIPLPAYLIQHFWIFDNTIWLRFGILVYLFIAALMAISSEKVFLAITNARPSGVIERFLNDHKIQRPALKKVLGLLVAAVVLLWAFAPFETSLPITSSSVQYPTQLPQLLKEGTPNGAVVQAFPYLVSGSDSPMLWQAEDRFSFRLVAGYATVPEQGHGSYQVNPTNSQLYLNETLQSLTSTNAALNTASGLTAVNACQTFAQMITDTSTQTLVLWPFSQHWNKILAFFKPLIGEPSVQFSGGAVWFHLLHRVGVPKCEYAAKL